VIVCTVGTTVLAAGIAMLVLPGPGILVIAGALAILATEFAWASHLLRRVRREIHTRTGIGPAPAPAPDTDQRRVPARQRARE
jgi:tellurite resistance protein TerC